MNRCIQETRSQYKIGTKKTLQHTYLFEELFYNLYHYLKNANTKKMIHHCQIKDKQLSKIIYTS